MDAFTHGLASYAITRAVFPRASRTTLIVAILAGAAADLDQLSAGVSPSAFLDWHRTYTHSVVGTLGVTIVFCIAAMLATRHKPNADSLRTVFLALLAASTLRTAMDLTQNESVQVLWPFRAQRYSADCALLAIFIYVGARFILHGNAVAMMEARTYRGELPRRVAAFAESDSPFHWHCIVEAERAFHDLDLNLAPGSLFTPDAAAIFYKPESSAPLDAARNTESVRRFLLAAKFPKATVEKTNTGYRVQLRDLAEQREARSGPRVIAVVETDPNAKVLSDEVVWDRKM